MPVHHQLRGHERRQRMTAVLAHSGELRRKYQMLRPLVLMMLASVAAAQPSSSTPLNLAGRPGCGGPVSGQLPAGLTTCAYGNGVMANSTQLFIFNTPGDGSYNVLVLLGTAQGDASLVAWLPGQNASEAPAINGVYTYITARTMESYLFIPAAKLAAEGPVTLGVRNVAPASVAYSIQVYTHLRNTTLDPAEASALADINRICCSSPISSQTLGVAPQPGSVDFCVTGLLANASNPNRTPGEDICNRPPFACDGKGRLLRFPANHAGFNCQGNIRPWATFTELVHLDLSSSAIGTTTQAVAELVTKLPKLRRLQLVYSRTTGPLRCEMIGASLQMIALAGNGISGTIPECFISASNLTEIYLGTNSIEGPLPDAFEGSKLRFLYVPTQNGRTLNGPLPPSFSRSSLLYVALGGNALSGTIPPLPRTLVYLNVSDNQLSGPLPELGPGVGGFEAAYNTLSGTIPQDLSKAGGMLLYDVSGNQLTGTIRELPRALQELGVAGNSFTGQLPPLPSALVSLNASYNQLSGDVSSLPLAQMARLLMAGNQLTGSLTPELLAAPRLAALDLSGNQLTGTIPGAALALPSLALLALSNNKLTGNLAAAAQALAARQNNSIFTFSVAGNQLSGELPQQLSSLALFDTRRPTPAAPTTAAPLPRVFNISGNQLTGAFPTYVLTQFPALAANCTFGRCVTAVSVAGPAMSVACPSGDALQNADAKFNTSVLGTQQLECLSPSGERVPVVPYLQSGGTYKLGSASSGLSAGAIAGVVVSVVVVAAVAAAAAWYVISKRKQGGSPAFSSKPAAEPMVGAAQQV